MKKLMVAILVVSLSLWAGVAVAADDIIAPLNITGNKVVIYDSGSSSKLYLRGLPTEVLIGSVTNHPVKIMTNNANRVWVTKDGEVGIGTNPSGAWPGKLEVRGKVLIYDNPDAGSPRLYLRGLSTEVLIGSGTNHPVKIITNGTEKVTVTKDGYVGIGRMSPTAKLDVNGDVIATDFLLDVDGDPVSLLDVLDEIDTLKGEIAAIKKALSRPGASGISSRK